MSAKCVAISIVPGVIRWGEHNGTFDRIREIRTSLLPSQSSPKEVVEVFDRERKRYLGLTPRTDNLGLEIESLLSASAKILLLRTYIRSSQNSITTGVDWLSAINAIAVSVQVNEQDMFPAAEESLANIWLKEGIWDRMIWAPAHGAIAGGRFGKMASAQAFVSNYLTMRYGHEKLRFFVAGRCRGPRIYLRQGTTPLIQ
jgi:hypothetical protein